MAKTANPNVSPSAAENHLRPVIEVHMEIAMVRHIRGQRARIARAIPARSFKLASCSNRPVSDLCGLRGLESRITQVAITKTTIAQPIAELTAAAFILRATIWTVVTGLAAKNDVNSSLLQRSGFAMFAPES